MSAAATEHYDVAVVGAGPAGAVAALQLARHSASVLLVDRACFPRTKVCGCCLNRGALATLERLGLEALVQRIASNPVSELRLAAGPRTVRLMIPTAAAASRAVLDAALVDAARAVGAAFLDNTSASWLAVDGHTHRLRLRAASHVCEVSASAVIAADGVAGRLLDAHPEFARHAARRSRIGLATILDGAPAGYEPGTIHMACARHGYVGLVRLEDGALDVAAAVDPGFMRRAGGAAASVSAMLGEVGWHEPAGLAAARWRGTPPLTHRRRCVGHDGVFVVGDAAGYVEPFTGEGIAWALRGGEAVAEPVMRVIEGGARRSAEAMWRVRHAELVAGPQRRCRAIASVLRRPMLARAMVVVAHHLPWAARPITDAIAAPVRCGLRVDRRSLALTRGAAR